MAGRATSPRALHTCCMWPTLPRSPFRQGHRGCPPYQVLCSRHSKQAVLALVHERSYQHPQVTALLPALSMTEQERHLLCYYKPWIVILAFCFAVLSMISCSLPQWIYKSQPMFLVFNL